MMTVTEREQPRSARVPSLHHLEGAARVSVLDADPDLGAAISERDRPPAVRAAIAPAVELPKGAWSYFPPADPESLGGLILQGVLVVRIATGTRAHVEMLGAGDVISPWVGTGNELNVPSEVTGQILSELQIAMLDPTFALRTARWPSIQAALMRKLITRARRLGLQAAIHGIPRIEERLELTLWHLADRFGRVTPEGTLLPVRLTHALLADLIAARRPSVTLALAKLEERGHLVRQGRDRWILTAEAPATLAPLARQAGLVA